MWGPGLRAELKRIWGLDPLEATPGVGDRLCGQREEETSPRAYQRRPPRPTGQRRPSPALRPELRPFQAGGHPPGPPPLGPQENTLARRQTQHLRSQRNSEAPESPHTRDPAGKAGAAGRSRNFLLPRARPAVASRPTPRALPLSLPADWKRPRRRPSWGRGRAAPRGRQARLGCKLSGEAGGRAPRGQELTGPRPGPAAAAAGASRARAEPDCRFSFGGRGGGHKSRGPWAALALPGQSSTWALLSLQAPPEVPLLPLLLTPPPLPACCPRLGKNLISPRSQGPSLGQRARHPGPVRDLDAPGPHPQHPLSRKQVRSCSARGGPSCPCLGRTFSGLGVLRWGSDARPSESDASGGARHCAGMGGE